MEFLSMNKNRLLAKESSKMSYKLSELKGVSASLAKSLAELGITDSDQLLLAAVVPSELKAMAARLGISETVLQSLANRADLLRVPGIGPAYTELLNDAGINSVDDLRSAGLGLFDRLVKAGETLGVKSVPKQTEVTAWVNAAKEMPDAADWAIATKSEALRSLFADDEWVKVTLAPLAAAALVITASPSSKGDTEDELSAAAGALNHARAAARPEALLNVAFPKDVTMGDFGDFLKTTPRAAMASTIKAATDLVCKNAGAAQLAAYQAMVKDVAQKAAEAAKEGGFLGMGKQLVSEDEQQALNEINQMLS
jgi:predicted flap endonuclease-1-like 5' DNA nuclease